jgi:hydroxymethylglutaryl-CoA synthase
MAANAVLDLIIRFDVDPRDVGFLGFGTESSTDNAAGAVLIRGMVDDALQQLHRPPLDRRCEVPEFKHACLGGVYGLKSATRYLSCDGRGRRAIVVSADIAEYERGSTGEQTQGAGAVAVLLDTEAALCELDLCRAGSASAYRGPDFRKPFARHLAKDYAPRTKRQHDFPIFNGRYSTVCYLEATMRALDAMLERSGRTAGAFYEELAAIVCHRPYQHMPIQAMATALLWGRVREHGRDGIEGLCRKAGVDPAAVVAEVARDADLFSGLHREGPNADPFPALTGAAKQFRQTDAFDRFVREKMSLGLDVVRDLGNLYTASLPAWLGAALEDAHHGDVELEGRSLLALGYGSGDAAEAIPMRVVPSWRTAASKLAFAEALEGAIDLDRAQYEALHDGEASHGLDLAGRGFVVDRVGDRYDPEFQDLGIEYYRFIPA